ncbi:histidine phosphatase superfamily [Biscogniauxia marginata]|nr:histidine phosphatase superfamily [Biscogniauxia marginata]
MAPIIEIIRHAEARNNVEGPHVGDPELTPKGQDQCYELAQSYPEMDKIAHIVASPMKRTILTAIITFIEFLDAGKKVTVLPELQENSARACDTGSPLHELKLEFDDYVEWGGLPQTWFDKGLCTRFAPEKDKVEERARVARAWLRDLARRTDPDRRIVVVTHGAFAHFLTEDFSGLEPGRGSGVFPNAGWKSYRFADLDGRDDRAALVLSEEEKSKAPGPHWDDLDGAEKSRLRGYALERLERHYNEAKKIFRGLN